MTKNFLLAGLMAATVMGGIGPAYAQQGDGNGWRGRGNQAGRSDGDRGDRGRADGAGQRWQGGNDARPGGAQPRTEQPRPAPQPDQTRLERQWQGGRPGRDDNVRPAWRTDNRVVGQPPAERPQWRGDAQRGEIRQDWRYERREGDRDNHWRDDGRRGSGNVVTTRRFDDRSRWTGQRRWDNDWRQDRRYDWSSYRSRYGDRYRLGRYYAPRGWSYGYSRFSVGVFLNGLLYDQSYWIDDPWSYRLPPAYGTLRWVRYYDDALLVDIRDGYVVDVIHDFFW
ncbi:RcnB family protein [Sphingobium mellinum]|uniref:RcnB family protein n=1 Tax=Sphingobium mellinum TaxID=1387166 RepID=UPI0030EDF112